MYASDSIPNNLRVLLWKRQVVKARWVEEVSRWCQCEEARAERLLSGKVQPNDDETRFISQLTGISPEQLVFESLLDGINVLAENLKFLLDALKHGEQPQLASYLGVSVGTVRKWKGGSQPPNKGHQIQILRFFRLNLTIDLTKEPLFLSTDPIGLHAKKEWLLDRLREIDDDRFDKYYPAIRKILE